MRTDLQHAIEIVPAYDHSAKGGRQHCVDMTWYVTGAKGVVQFRLFTGWGKDIIQPPGTNWLEMHVNGGQS